MNGILFNEYTKLIEKSMKEGYFKKISMSVFMSMIIGPIKEIQYQYQVSNESIDETVMKELYDSLLNGILNT
jgi:hypothetical protein